MDLELTDVDGEQQDGDVGVATWALPADGVAEAAAPAAAASCHRHVYCVPAHAQLRVAARFAATCVLGADESQAAPSVVASAQELRQLLAL